MSDPHQTVLSWSSGKDAAMALYELQQNSNFSVEKLVVTVSQSVNRVTMHGLRKSLLEDQLKSINIPYHIIELPESPSMDVYNKIMDAELSELHKQHYSHLAYGDIFLEDLKIYRENQLKKQGLKGVFPLWKKDTHQVIEYLLDKGFKAIVIAADAKCFDSDFVGTVIDHHFVDHLPPGVDPCGENGEFHTFCFDGPVFTNPVSFTLGERVKKMYPAPNKETETAGFWYLDLIPNTQSV